MCGICAIITPYNVHLDGGPSSVDPAVVGPQAPSQAGRRTDTPPNVNDDDDLEPDSEPTSTTSAYPSRFKYQDARPKKSDAQPPYTEIQRPISAGSPGPAKGDPQVAEQITRDVDSGIRGSDGVKAKVKDLRDDSVDGYWVKTKPTTTPTTPFATTTNGDHPHATPTAADEDNSASPYRKRLEDELLASLESIAHRGPDGKGIWVGSDCRVALGHVRLSIRDLSVAGRQPMHSTTDDVHIVVNGEIYMYEELKSTLQALGYTFHSTSDSELVLYLYQEYGQDFLHHLRGEFSLIVYDSAKRLVIAARDRYGIKPLFWTKTPEGRILIGAEIKSFLGLGVKPEWDVKSLRECGWLYDTRTILKGVNRLRPGHMLIIGLDGRLDEKPYWEPSYPDKNTVDTRTFEEMVLGVRERLIDAVACRLRADVPVGVYLSGGIDSSVVAGIIVHLMKNGLTAGSQESRRLKCFTIEFDAGAHNEVAIARRTADHLGVDFNPMHASEEMLVDNFERAVWAIEQPANDLNFVGKYMLSRFVSGQGYPVVLTGEGADEHFAGYSLFLADYLAEPDLTSPDLAIPTSTRESHLARVRNLSSSSTPNAFTRNPLSFEGKENALRSINHLEYPQIQSNGLNDPLVFSPWTGEYGVGNPLLNLLSDLSPITRRNIQSTWHPLHSALYLSHRPMDGIVLSSLGDRSEMGHSLEGRPPFLDAQLTDYVDHLPPSAKITIDPVSGKVVEKHVLREASRPFISDELYNRTKHPYSAPTAYPEGGLVHGLLCKHVTREKLEGLGFVDVNYCLKLLDEAFSSPQGKEGNMNAFRQVLMLAQFTLLASSFGIERAQPVEQL